MLPHEIEHGLSQQRRESVSCADIYFAFFEAEHVVNPVDTRLGVVNSAQGRGQESLANICQGHRVTGALEELYAQFAFECGYLLRECALCYVKSPCRLRKVKEFGSCGKIFQLSQFHLFYLVAVKEIFFIRNTGMVMPITIISITEKVIIKL